MIDLLRPLVKSRLLMSAISPVLGKFNPFHPDYRNDPYPTYSRLRKEAPIYRHPLFGIWILSRHADVKLALKDPRFSVSRALADATVSGNPLSGMNDRQASAIRNLLMFLDPPDHTRIRNLASGWFIQRNVDVQRPRIQEIADRILDHALGTVGFELMEGFAIPFPLQVITEILGVPTGDMNRFRRWSTCLTTLFDPLNGPASVAEAVSAFDELDAYLADLFERRKREPKDDLISALVTAHEKGNVLSALELLSIASLILVGGHETVASFIGGSILALADNPAELERLRREPALIEPAVEELLRYTCPIQATHRVLTADVEIGGKMLPKGSVTLCLLGSANRDPAAFRDPDLLDIARTPSPHLAFGYGAHYCLGAYLARVECQIALQALLDRIPEDFSVDRASVTWSSSIFLRGPKTIEMDIGKWK